MKNKYFRTIATISICVAALYQCAIAAPPKKAAKGEEKNATTPREERVYALMREAAAYPVTDVAGCIAGVKIASSLYADLLRQGALQSEEYTKFSIETQLKFALENGTPVDINAFRIAFEMLRTNNASWIEVSGNDGNDYAQQNALWEVITCKFNSGYAGIPKNGPIPKEAVIQIIELMISEQRRSK